MSDLLPAPPQTWDGFDLYAQGKLLGAAVFKPNPLQPGGYEGGRVLTYDDEGMLVCRFSRFKGKLEMHAFRLFYSEIDSAATEPGSIYGRNRLARDILLTMGQQKGGFTDWDLKVLGHVSYMLKPRAT